MLAYLLVPLDAHEPAHLTRLIRTLCPGRVLPAVFSLAGCLSSTDFATACAALFARFEVLRTHLTSTLIHLRRTASAFPERPAR